MTSRRRLDDFDAGLLSTVGEVVVTRADVVVLSGAREAQHGALVRRRRVVQQVVHVVFLLHGIFTTDRRRETAETQNLLQEHGRRKIVVTWDSLQKPTDELFYRPLCATTAHRHASMTGMTEFFACK